jgi:hypothetical protein
MNRTLISTAIDEATEYIQDVSELKGARPKRGGKIIRKLSKAFYDVHLLEKQLNELKELVDLFNWRKTMTNDSILMAGDLKRLTELINKL